MIKASIKQHVADLIFALCILPSTLMLLPMDHWFEKYPLFTSLLVAYLYLLYFSIRLVHLPSLLLRQKYLHFAIFCTVALLGVHMLSRFPHSLDVPSRLPDDLRIHLRAQTVWLLSLFVIAFSLSLELAFQLMRNDIARSRAELASYQAQINPHFLFNTLNSIHSLIAARSDKAEPAFGKFTEMLRYMYTHAAAETIDIATEADCIRQYIELQQLRLNQHTTVHWHQSIDDPDAPIPPMLLLPFVENAFKYGVSASQDCQISINMYLANHQLHFTTRNEIMRQRDEGPSIGIENCRHRLHLLYPRRYHLRTGTTGNTYTVHLKINLK